MKKIAEREHHFRVDEAQKYGIEKAVLLYNIRFWLEKNEANKKNIKELDGKKYYWTFNSSKAFQELFPYFKESTLRRWLVELETDRVIISDSFNKIGYDRTKWYTLPEYEIIDSEQSIAQNEQSNAQNEQPIPDNKTQIVNTYTLVAKRNEEVKETPPLYSFEEELKKLYHSKQKRFNIIHNYWVMKGWSFNNEKQFSAKFKRELRPAGDLVGYTSQQINKGMEYCKNNYDVWTLETVVKRLPDLVNKKQ